MKLSVVTFNVWGLPLASKDLLFRAEKIAEEVCRLDADVVLLQEAISTKFQNVLKKRLKSNGYKFCEFQHGLGIVSRFKLKRCEFKRFNLGGGFFDGSIVDLLAQKGVLMCEIKVGSRLIKLINTHLVSSNHETRSLNYVHYQTVEILQRMAEVSKNQLMVVGGDLNQTPESVGYGLLVNLGNLKDLSEGLITLDRGNSYRKNVPKHAQYQMDYLFFRETPGWKLRHKSRLVFNNSLVKDGVALNYSDHYGVMAEIVFKPVMSSAEDIISRATSPASLRLKQLLSHHKHMAGTKMLMWIGLLVGFLILGWLAQEVLPAVFVAILGLLVLATCMLGIYSSGRELVFAGRIYESIKLNNLWSIYGGKQDEN